MNESDKKKYKLCNAIKKFSTADILQYVNSYSSIVFNDLNSNYYGTINKKLQIYTNKGIHNLDLTISPWWLLDLAFYAIQFSSDYKNPITDYKQFEILYAFSHDYAESLHLDIKKLADKDYGMFIVYIFSFASEQFKYQRINLVIQNFNRDLYILLNIMNKVDKNINIDDIIQNNTGNNWKGVCSCLLLIFYVSLFENNIDNILERFIKDEKTKKRAFEVVNYYSLPYYKIRNSNLKRLIFNSKPFVIDSNNRHLSISCYLNYFVFEHCIYWIVRDHYLNIKSQRFTNAFGKCFEYYFKELLQEYVDSERFLRIDESNRKRADWYVDLNGYEMIVELKSSTTKLSIKNQNPDINDIEHFIENTIIEATEQLNETEMFLNKKGINKIILLYDDYLYTQIMTYINQTFIYNRYKHSGCYLMSISEMEILLYHYKNNYDSFLKMIEEKRESEKTNKQESTSFDKWFVKYGFKNEHIYKQRYNDYFEDIDKEVVSIIGL